MTTLFDADAGRVLGVVNGRDPAGVGTWLAAHSAGWRDAVEVVAIDPSAAFCKALREQLPHAAVSVDPSTWYCWPTTCSPRCASGSSARPRAAAASTRPGPTAGCCRAPGTPSAHGRWHESRGAF
jgi:hypothetical protein